MELHKSLLICLLFVTLNIFISQSAYCHGKPGQYYNNSEPIWKDTPRLIKTHKFGKLYEIGTNTTTMKLLHVYGNMYEMGFAHGYLLRD
jgi:isopenicillin-N N-acyltransferase-like protein